jgi:hypothetical protein
MLGSLAGVGFNPATGVGAGLNAQTQQNQLAGQNQQGIMQGVGALSKIFGGGSSSGDGSGSPMQTGWDGGYYDASGMPIE